MYFKEPIEAGCAFFAQPNTALDDQKVPKIYQDQAQHFPVKRSIEFLNGRYCALQAFKKAGFKEEIIIETKEDKSPYFQGKIGSISHSDQLACALIARIDSDIQSIGVDLELSTRFVMPKLQNRILLKSEFHLLEHKHYSQNTRLILLFSIKETIYKCYNSYFVSNLQFQDVQITKIAENHADVVFLKKGMRAFKTMKVQYQIIDDHILTSTAY